MNNLGLDRTAAAMLMIESDMPGPAAIDELERAEATCRVAGATDVVRAADAQEADWLRQARRAAHYALERLGEVRMEDVGVPRGAGPRHAPRDRADRGQARRQDRDVRARRRRQPPPDLVFERGDPNAEAKTEAVKKDLYQAALDLGGPSPGEHGIGSARREWLEIQKPTRSASCARSRPRSTRSAS